MYRQSHACANKEPRDDEDSTKPRPTCTDYSAKQQRLGVQRTSRVRSWQSLGSLWHVERISIWGTLVCVQIRRRDLGTIKVYTTTIPQPILKSKFRKSRSPSMWNLVKSKTKCKFAERTPLLISTTNSGYIWGRLSQFIIKSCRSFCNWSYRLSHSSTDTPSPSCGEVW